jgi:hypothetical protein
MERQALLALLETLAQQEQLATKEQQGKLDQLVKQARQARQV